MSNINPHVTNHDVIPTFQTDVFYGHPDSQFAIGIIGVGETVVAGREAEYEAYLRLRAKVYVDQTNMLDRDQVRPDGTEIDEDDKRSVHFAIIENAASDARVVASMRLIVKSHQEARPLPIEDFFPGAFPEPAPAHSVEVSRYICRHENLGVQERLKWPLFGAVVSYIIANGFPKTYGVVEPALERSLQDNNVPLRRIADPKYVEEYSADNLGLEIDIVGLARAMQLTPQAVEYMRSHSQRLIYTEAERIPRTQGKAA